MKLKFLEKRLIRKIQNGDAEAFAQVYDAYIDKIYKFIYYKVRTQEQAEDLTSQVFTKLLEYILSGKEIENLQALIYRVARNQVVDHYRSSKVEVPIEFAVRETAVSFEAEIGKKEGLMEIEKALRKLKGEIKEAMLLRYIDDYSIREVAEILGKSEGSVRVMIHRARKEIKGKLLNKDKG
ncbi:sigma-70 family RNA polymerase sigma factor [Candidatus Falkowbacteria bacterium]|nr:sigma-70 family RNA polymerase sigma factor [Candidatus Falkowbacteria bacterium]